MLRVLTCVTQDHDWRLVLLSAGICLIGCFSAVVMLAQAVEQGERRSQRWLLGAAGVFGSSVWSLHFVAMLAFLPRQHIAYAIGLTVLSIAVAIGGSLAALLLWQRSRQAVKGAALAGAGFGLSIAGMHYLGVGAMQGFWFIQLDPADRPQRWVRRRGACSCRRAGEPRPPP
jgi:NO-binding membrane sensor protein with MHYT domain